jgi:non-ribosomal peptide synthetase-like protein
LHHFFERSCDARPDAPALVCETEALTYGELEERANRLAHHLIRHGVRPGDRVGLRLDRSASAYVALLAVLKCGAAFVPIDPAFPTDRIAFIAADAGLRLLLCTPTAAPADPLPCPVQVVDGTTAADEPASRPAVADGGNSLAYVIYTSGTTGRPKGVAVTQASICNFLAACTPIYGVTAADRVYQGMTLAFDFSIEEVWPTFAAGATLVAGPTDHRRLGAGLNDFLIDQGITVLCCVPTLLATLERDVPGLRTLLVGGEACPADLVERWARPGRRMLNTYGPTETTVTCTWTELTPGRPVTIGRPLPTYTAHLLDAALNPVPAGEPGEVCVGGPGVAAGYVNRPGLTAERFIPDPFSRRPGARLYRTGDRGRLTPAGEIEYLGRIDAQVKVRGYRIELAEVETVLLDDAGVAAALAAVVPGEGGVQELAAFVIPHGPADAESLRRRLHDNLRQRLPAYMVPAFIDLLDVLPTLPSGKADRSRLPTPCSPRLGAGDATGARPETARERELAAAWGAVFGRAEVPTDADFFLDLGGHSLFAALVASKLRQSPNCRHLSVGDIYRHPTVRGLASHLESTAPPGAGAAMPPPPREVRRHGSVRVLACGAGQFALLYLAFVLLGAPLALWLSRGGAALTDLAAGAATAVAALPVLSLLLPLLAKWLLIGRFRPGRHPLWGWYYCRWWLVRKLLQAAPLDYLAGSPLLAPYLRLLGYRVGLGCHLGTSKVGLPDLVALGNGVSLGYGTHLEPFLVRDGFLHLAPIRIGDGAFVGTNSVVLLGGRVGAGARVLEQSLVARDQTIPDGETWAGSPSGMVAADAQLEAMAARNERDRGQRTEDRRNASCGPLSSVLCPSGLCLLAGFVAGFLLLELLPLLFAAPGVLFLAVVSDGDWLRALAWTPVAGLIYVLTACVVIAAGKRLVMPTARPGLFPLRSFFGLRKWLADKLMMISLAVTNSLYATLYTLPWLRLLGAKVGRRSEVSTVSNIDPDLLTLGAESFVADLAVIGASRHHAGTIALGATEVGSRSFVGNAALLPGESRLPPGCLVGVQSVPPAGPVEPGTSWLGSPAIFLPRRQDSGKFDESVTFHPPARLVAGRLAVEYLRVTLPAALGYAALLLAGLATVYLADRLTAFPLLLTLPAVYFASALLVVAAVALLKWLVVGRYRPRVEPLWSHFVWRTELITGLYESAAVPWLLGWLTGTPLLRPILRLFGARIGRRVYLETTYLTEFDLVRVGDDAAVAGLTSLQTHLFEDRVMKMSAVTVGPGCTVGPRAVVLYDAVLGAGAELDGLSLAMKGETLPANTHWRGIPAQPASAG